MPTGWSCRRPSIRETEAAEVAEAEPRQHEPPGRMHRARNGGSAHHVYTVRMPAKRLAELRAVAEQSGEQPSALMRRWVLQRLDVERAHQPELADVRRTLSEALHTLDQVARRLWACRRDDRTLSAPGTEPIASDAAGRLRRHRLVKQMPSCGGVLATRQQPRTTLSLWVLPNLKLHVGSVWPTCDRGPLFATGEQVAWWVGDLHHASTETTAGVAAEATCRSVPALRPVGW